MKTAACRGPLLRALALQLVAALALGTAARASEEAFPAEAVAAEDGASWAETFAIGLPAEKATVAAKAAAPVPSRRLGLSDPSAPQVVLSVIDNEALLREDETLRALQKFLRVSVERPVTLEAMDGAWQTLPSGGALWVADLVSPGAFGLRVHLVELALPAGAELALYPGELAEAPALDAASPAVELLAGASSGERWTRTFGGDRARIEYFDPHGPVEVLPFRVASLQHVYRDLVALQPWFKAAGPCHNDVTCFPEFASLAAGVGMLGVIGSGGGGFCTGQLLNSLKPDFTPYFLTANHCLSTGGQAAATEVFWNYQTATCGGPPPSLNSLPRSVGTTLVSTGTPTDYTLLLIEGTVPRNLFWLGWTSKAIANGTPAVAVHHPAADFKRISFATRGTGTPVCGFTSMSNHVRIDWVDGPTEPGSSGSGIFRRDNGQLFGQLHCGPSACGNETYDAYGDFSKTYPKVKKALAGGTDDKYEQNDTCPKARKIKAGNSPARIVKVLDEDWYRITVPQGRSVRIQLDFAHGNGDIDVEMFPRCGDAPFVVSRGTGNQEVIEVQNIGSRAADAFFRVFLHDDTRNAYNLNVVVH